MEELITQKEAAELLKVSTKTLQEWRRAGKIKFYKFGHRTVRYSLRDIHKMKRGGHGK